jgi:phage terminase small subunit
MSDLTPKQEAFALAYVETGNAAEAYRRAYDVRAATTHSSIYSAASHLLDNPKIRARVDSLQAEAATLSLYTVKAAFDEYEAARKLAMAEGVSNPSAAVAAVNGKVKLFGLDRPDRLELTGKDGEPVRVEVGGAEKLAEFLNGIAERGAKAGDADA